MALVEHPAGFEFDSDDAFIPVSYAVHAAMAAGGSPDTPGTPVVMIEFEGYAQSDLPLKLHGRVPLRRASMLLERPPAEGLLDGIHNSLRMLDHLARNPDA